MNLMFQKDDIVISKEEFLSERETSLDTIGVVLDYNPENDALLLGVLHPENYGIAPTFAMRGEYYRLATEEEIRETEELEDMERE